MRRVLPGVVVDTLVAFGKRVPGHFRPPEGSDYYKFPFGDEIPVVVATRLSLSFPILLSAIRLYSLTNAAYERSSKTGAPLTDRDFESHWISDGGIASNFPIHLFDRWWPQRPTFGITLYDSPTKKLLDQRESAGDVVLPLPRDFDRARPRRVEITGVTDFLRAILETAQCYRDNTQSALPSYRERIAQVFLRGDEGGLNLDMPVEVVKSMQDKGRRAGQELVARYADSQGSSFSEHRWVRLLLVMGQLEQELLGARAASGSNLAAELQGLIDEQLAAEGERRWYRPENHAWCTEAMARLASLNELIESWHARELEWKRAHNGHGLFHKPPQPEGLLRITTDL